MQATWITLILSQIFTVRVLQGFDELLRYASRLFDEDIEIRGCSSVGRASRCQRDCRRFESVHPLFDNGWQQLSAVVYFAHGV